MALFGFIGRNNKYDRNLPVDVNVPWGFGDSELEQRKLQKYTKNWKAFIGEGYNEVKPAHTGSGSQGHTAGKVNYTKTVVNRMKSFAFAKRWHTFLDFMPYDFDEENPSEIPADIKSKRLELSKMLRYADNIFHKLNAGDSIRLETALFCSVTGDAYMLILPILPESIEIDLYGGASNVNRSKIRVMTVNPEYAKPDYGPDGMTMVQFTLRYPVVIPGDSGQGMFEQVITPQTITETTYSRGKTAPLRTRTIPNPLGRVFAVHIKNYPTPGKYGMDDVEPIRGAVQELNDKISDVSDIIDYHASPTTLVFGARVSTLEKGSNKVWSGLPTTARIENLQLDGDLAAMNQYIELLRTMIKEASGVNEAALGSDLAISNTSGVALHTRFYSMLSIAEEKWAAWSPHVKSLYSIILLWGRHLGQISFTDELLEEFENSLEVQFSSNLPKDVLLEIQKNVELINAELKPRAKAMADLGSRDPQADMLAIQQEKKSRLAVDGDADRPTVKKSVDSTADAGIEEGSTGRNLASFRAPTEANPS